MSTDKRPDSLDAFDLFLRALPKVAAMSAQGLAEAIELLDRAIELSPGYETGRHFHDEQEELYFLHRGKIEITLDDDTFLLGPGGLARVDASTIRKIKNVGDEPAVYLVTGGKDGYVGRDGRLPEGETSRVSGGPPGA